MFNGIEIAIKKLKHETPDVNICSTELFQAGSIQR
jgi:hypothetical protein